ncbi:uncharacterized protein LOC107030058 [Solanum pennellii]|uniref:Uncharacterized protein LOC107030058 n=1 Tax=Solanum pennellii TaxID=28526 RepID=A0ABM1HKW0_SOLPN|nr:uncharacterized protein LOC107030058 [Solanum pennellii]
MADFSNSNLVPNPSLPHKPQTSRAHHMKPRNMNPSTNLASASTPSPPTIEPTCFTEANKYKEWRAAMTYELDVFLRNDTWSLVPYDPSMNALTNSDWAGCIDDHKSTGGYAIYLGVALVSWSSKKQCTVSTSFTESEYKALAMQLLN